MIQPVSSTLSIAPTARNRDASSPARFARSLAVVQAAGDGKDDPDDGSASTVDDGKSRQDGADDGSDLPKGDAPIDPRLAWLTLPGVVPVAVPLPATNAVATGTAAAATTPLTGQTPPTTPPVLPPASTADVPGLMPIPTPPAPTGAVTATASIDAVHTIATSPTPSVADSTSATDAADPLAIAKAPLPIALPDPSRQAIATPALQAFAGAIHAGLKREENARDAADPLAAPGMTTLAPMETVRHAVAAAGGAQEQMLDTRREHWPASMIDHIESLRDAADANNSRIRVMPDALGTIDLSVKRDGDTLHVHFNADQAATRAMLTDAQPQLAEIAQSRGLRLGDTNVSGGGASGQQSQQQRTPAQPASARPTPAAATIAAVATDDTRIG